MAAARHAKTDGAVIARAGVALAGIVLGNHDRDLALGATAAIDLSDGLLADAVPRGEGEEVGALVGGVVVDVHRREPGPALCHVLEEVRQGLPLLGVTVGTEGPERAVPLDEAEQVVEPPLWPARLAVGPVLLSACGVLLPCHEALAVAPK